MAKGGKKAGSGASKSVSAAAVKVQEDVWAQCDNPNCQKWRRLPPGTVIDENTPWYCYMNPDEENAACEAPEESYRLDVELEPGYDEPEHKTAPASRHSAGKSKSRSYADKGKSSSRSNQYSSQLWQGAPRTHSGGNSQGTKRRPDSDARLDSTYDSKRARLGTSAKSAEANGHSSPGKHEADAGTAPDLQGTSSGGLRHSLRPRRPPSYPLKEESPPPPGPSRQHQGSIRHGQGSSRPPSGQSQRAQAAAARPTQKARKQHKGFEKLLALGGLWEIVKGKGKAITPAPFWVWEGLATHTPAAAELAAQAADVASAARYFEGGNFPSGAAQAAESAALKRQAMTAAAVLGLDATSQIPDVIAAGPSKPTAAVAAASKPHQPASAVDNHAVPQMPSQSQAAASSQGQALLQMPSQMPAHGKPQSLSHILAQTQPQSQLQSQPHSQSQSQSQPQSMAQSQAHSQTQPAAVFPDLSQMHHAQGQGHPTLSLHAQHQQQLLKAHLSNRMLGQSQHQQPAASHLPATLPLHQSQIQQQQQQQGRQLQHGSDSGQFQAGPVHQQGQHQQQPPASGQHQSSPAAQLAPPQSTCFVGLSQQAGAALQPGQQQLYSSSSESQASAVATQAAQMQSSQAVAFPQLELRSDNHNGIKSAAHVSGSLQDQSLQQQQQLNGDSVAADAQHSSKGYATDKNVAAIAMSPFTGSHQTSAVANGFSGTVRDEGK
ncbi:TPA: hypothetical protein ACH3X2_009276 [Trebouxia sp. C0005]